MPSLPGTESRLWVAVLAGGVGSRFWPASTPARPKPLLALASEQPLIRDTVDRALSLVEPRRLSILTGAHLVSPFRSILLTLEEENFWVEPQARGTGPVLAWAAHRILRSDPEAVLVSLHADHRIEPESAFPPLIRSAAELARTEDILLTIAVSPDRPETGYGYIRRGEPLANEDFLEAFRIGEFIEKPDLAAAEKYLSSGYWWNSGIFVLPVARFLHEIRLHAPEIGGHLPLLDRGDDAAFFEEVPTVSVDETVFERSGRVGAVKANFRWDDLGSWESLTRSLASDAAGNCGLGDLHAVDSQDSVVWAEDGPVVLFGVDNLVVVRSGGITLVTSRQRSPQLKHLLARLPEGLREGSAGSSPTVASGGSVSVEPDSRSDE